MESEFLLFLQILVPPPLPRMYLRCLLTLPKKLCTCTKGIQLSHQLKKKQKELVSWNGSNKRLIYKVTEKSKNDKKKLTLEFFLIIVKYRKLALIIICEIRLISESTMFIREACCTVFKYVIVKQTVSLIIISEIDHVINLLISEFIWEAGCTVHMLWL